MLLYKRFKIHQVSSWLTLALTLIPCAMAQAAIIAAMPGTHAAYATTSVSESQQKIRQAFSGDSQPFYGASLAALYAARNMQPIWQDHEAVQKFQQQLAEVALSGVQPQFTRWVDRLTSIA